MAPLKFDDFHKAAKDSLHEDFHTSGYELKTKQKTNFNGAVVTCTSALSPGATTKISWKLPKFFGVPGFSVDKLEMDAKGKFKFEAAVDKGLHGLANLKVVAKSDLSSVEGVAVEATLSDVGVPETHVRIETKPLDIANFDFTADATYANGPAQVGVRVKKATLLAPDVAARFAQGPFFFSFLTGNKFGSCIAHAHYNLPVMFNPKLAGSYEYGGKKNGEYHVGVDFSPVDGTKVKAKFHEDAHLSVVVHHKLAAGFTLKGGAKCNTATSQMTYGAGISIE